MRPDKEIKSLTGLRGIAAAYVVMFHFFIGQHFTNPVTTLLAHGYLAVDVFFVLSGFVMTLTYSHLFDRGNFLSSYRNFLGRRIARVYPLYFVGTLCALVLVRYGILDPPHLPLKLALPWNLLMVQAWGISESLDGPGWSISAEWAAYLLYPAFLLWFARYRSGRWFGAMISLSVVAFLTVSPVAHSHSVEQGALLDVHAPLYGLPVFRCLAEFCLGMLAYRFSITTAGIRFAAISWVQDAIAALIVMLLMFPRTDFMMPCLIPILLVGLPCGRSMVAHLLSSRPFETAGRYSYSIYMIHTLLYGVLGWIHNQIAAVGLKHGQTYAALVGISLTVPLSAFAYHTIEKPGRSFIRDLLEGKTVVSESAVVVASLAPVKAGIIEPRD